MKSAFEQDNTRREIITGCHYILINKFSLKIEVNLTNYRALSVVKQYGIISSYSLVLLKGYFFRFFRNK